MRRFLNGNYLLILYGLAAVALFLYSYTQVDLSLTLTQASFWKTIQTAFQQIGFYERPLSAALYFLILGFWFTLYFYSLVLAGKNKLPVRNLFSVICGIGIGLTFAYPAFSYDFFNYMFTAKTVLVYGQNPYLVKPLDFTGVEPWLSFLRWTHLPTAYSPFWIILTLLPFLAGLGYFLLIMWSLKALISVSYVLAAYFIYRTLLIVERNNAVLGTAMFALNPLVVIEGVVSPHNDMVMMSLAVLAFFLGVTKRKLPAFLALALSAGVKTMTVFLYPAAFWGWNRKLALLGMTAAMIIGFFRKELLPWYALWVIPFAALNPGLVRAQILVSGLSAGLLLTYAPVLYYGDYAQPTITARLALFWGAVGLGAVCAWLYPKLSRR